MLTQMPPAAELVPRLVARLDDPAPEARFRAAELLACLGPTAAAHADVLATLLSDTGARTTRRRETVGEAALWGLARMNDPRCLPGLVEVIVGTRSGSHRFPPTTPRPTGTIPACPRCLRR
ncbi:hypothetical protein ACFWBF_29860 [Streptomyces sp. NPDC060028]|uniref:hypothetical protein n=1 Tax=Streptomyces sp. NPDC060028 TaxID=3347041 RepID=UPI0036C4C2C4